MRLDKFASTAGFPTTIAPRSLRSPTHQLLRVEGIEQRVDFLPPFSSSCPVAHSPAIMAAR
jgi:hypothetical protein